MLHLTLPAGTYVTTIALLIVLLQPAAAAVSLTPFKGAFAACPAISGLAWADEDNPGAPAMQQSVPATTPTATAPTPAATLEPQEKQTLPAGTQAPEGQQIKSPAEKEKPPPPGTPSKPGKAITEFVDLLHGELSQRILDTAVWMDSFFADERFVKEENHSYVKIRYDIFQEERANITFNPAVDLRLALPELERKTHLVFSAEPAQPAGGANAPVQTAGERFGQSEQRNLTTAIHYFFRSTAQESFLVRTGVQFSKMSPVLIFEPRYRVLFPFKVWNIRFTQDVLWKTNTSWQTDTRFDFERLLPREFFFRTTIDGVWAARTKGYIYSLSFSLREPLDTTHALDYEWINSYQTRPVGELTEVAFRVRYRHSFWREWLFFEISPQVRFPRDHNFDIVPGILFRLEIFFGGA